MKVATLVLALTCLVSGGAFAAEPLKLVSAGFLDVDAQLHAAKGHPNEEWRLNGLKSYLGGHYDEAVDRFERAAYFADKHAQHYLGLIFWHGQGVATDRVRGYIWSDLAAERGNRRLLAIRENMWSQLSAQERQQAMAEGAAFYDRYGDAVAQPRAEAEIRRFARGMTGSRVGFRNQAMDVLNGGPINGSFGNATPGMLAASVAVNGGTTGEKLYADERVRLKDYWRAQDRELERTGRVELGPITTARKP
ncbi:SEL1-like repeat protein [Lysobacter solisilvae (ex Woo and Kim 2020)]|uniref:SEL1-like repeat protein n=1 Tax=Agrilutibacter terrestris TaxID=2865112 RepID=A0A7H0FTV5_9GAMM|nr:SEL1-like repeat protein [Lysobacter terrestris]QNP39471.1 SEL1-like repeat protein [Lysobacter terrestris]